MKKTLLILLLLLVPAVAQAANLTVIVPQPILQKAQAMCELLRVEVRVRTADWSNDLCATIFTRVGLRVYVQRDERRGQQQILDDLVDQEIADFDTKWIPPFTPVECGDGILDIEFNEECDDGNNIDGDGCDFECVIEP